MNNTIKIYIALLVVVFVAILFIDSSIPKPIDHTPTYSVSDKIPLGLFVLDNEIDTLLKDTDVQRTNKNLYEFCSDDYVVSEDTTATDQTSVLNNYNSILYINNSAIIDEESLKKMYKFVSDGNNVFLSARTFPDKLTDTLKLGFDSYNEFKLDVYVANKKLSTKKYEFQRYANSSTFKKIDTLKTTVLGFIKGEKEGVNYIKTRFGSGYFYLHLNPEAFSNYYLLKKDTNGYAEEVLSYISKGKTLWLTVDPRKDQLEASPMRFILKQRALRWAWYLFLLGTILFVIFNIKRKQRAIPILEKLPNTTVEFAKTLGNLYFQDGQYSDIIDKKITYFLERIRSLYYLDTNSLDQTFIDKLHHKSGKDKETIATVVNIIQQHQQNPRLSNQADLIRLNKAIEELAFGC